MHSMLSSSILDDHMPDYISEHATLGLFLARLENARSSPERRGTVDLRPALLQGRRAGWRDRERVLPGLPRQD